MGGQGKCISLLWKLVIYWKFSAKETWHCMFPKVMSLIKKIKQGWGCDLKTCDENPAEEHLTCPATCQAFEIPFWLNFFQTVLLDRSHYFFHFTVEKSKKTSSLCCYKPQNWWPVKVRFRTSSLKLNAALHYTAFDDYQINVRENLSRLEKCFIL